jgi:hypothetical protein
MKTAQCHRRQRTIEQTGCRKRTLGDEKKKKEVDMPQDTDGSGLATLLWAFWIYWCVYRCLAHGASLEQQAHGQPGAPKPSFNPNPLLRLADVKGPRDLDGIISEIRLRGGTFTLDDFLVGALAAYETVIAAFNAGDRETLRTLVCSDVYDTFSNAIMARGTQSQGVEIVFSKIEPPQIVGGYVDDARIEVSVRFVGEFFRLSRNAAGQLTDATPEKCWSTDIWTFGRSQPQRDKTWRVTATEIG